ncbi:uncharacterized protein LOC127845911 [Dreissena polymorpha]|uniref:uncharacterized protein LOC127845911 n=1 Tax=Dreissena polymorpha TaxID=45954 RepID=UPI00226409A0|nr:uncharacterized protein LOC127845911 [Dreissena polymorpha]
MELLVYNLLSLVIAAVDIAFLIRLKDILVYDGATDEVNVSSKSQVGNGSSTDGDRGVVVMKSLLHYLFKETVEQDVKTTNKIPIVIYSNECSTMSGFVRKQRGVKTVLTEATDKPQLSGLTICPTVTSLEGEDLRSGYMQVEIAEEDKEKKAFAVGGFGFYLYCEAAERPSCWSSHQQSFQEVQDEETPWIWGDDQQKAFETIKHILTNPPVLGYAIFSKPFIVSVDASTECLGAVLYQEQDGLERVISYASRGIRASERNYPAQSSTFIVGTDNNPLTYVSSTAKLDATGHIWLAALGNYNLKAVYKASVLNRDEDGFSRRPQLKKKR